MRLPRITSVVLTVTFSLFVSVGHSSVQEDPLETSGETIKIGTKEIGGYFVVKHDRLTPQESIAGRRLLLSKIYYMEGIEFVDGDHPGLVIPKNLDTELTSDSILLEFVDESSSELVITPIQEYRPRSRSRYRSKSSSAKKDLPRVIWKSIKGSNEQPFKVLGVSHSDKQLCIEFQHPSPKPFRQFGVSRIKVWRSKEDYLNYKNASPNLKDTLDKREWQWVSNRGNVHTESRYLVHEITDDSEFQMLSSAFEDLEAHLKDVALVLAQAREAEGLAAEVLVFPEDVDFVGNKWGPDRGRAIGQLQRAYAGEFDVKNSLNFDMTNEAHLFIGFQKAWLELNPDPNEPMSTWNFTKNGYTVRNGWGVLVDQRDAVDYDFVVRTKYSVVVEDVYKDGIGDVERRWAPVARLFYSVYPPGSPTAEKMEKKIFDALNR